MFDAPPPDPATRLPEGGSAARRAPGEPAAAPALDVVQPAPEPAPEHAPPALSIRGLFKRFGDKVAVAGIDLDVPAGIFYGLVGPNGAGKTTTLSMATGLLRPDAGHLEILGVDVWSNPTAAKKLVGVLSDGIALFDRLSGEQLITYHGLLSGMDRADRRPPRARPAADARYDRSRRQARRRLLRRHDQEDRAGDGARARPAAAGARRAVRDRSTRCRRRTSATSCRATSRTAAR